MNKTVKLLVASGNQGKIKEIKDFLADTDMEVVGQQEYSDLAEVIEDGTTFKENALKKARTRAAETGQLTLADDSGLEVDYLDGRPGVYSARYAGLEADDEANNSKLLDELTGVPPAERTARFRCVMALVDPETGNESTVDGVCEGVIIDQPRGNNGFGYDPLFLVEEKGKTMAELPLEIKNRISHRAEALKKMKKLLNDRYC